MLLAVMAYLPEAVAAVGVPEIVPVIGLMLRPGGSAGVTEKLLTVPITVGESPAIACPTTAEIVLWAYTRFVGAAGFTTICTTVLVLPDALVAVTVKLPWAVAAMAVPEINPLDAFRLRPEGSPGLTL